MASKEVVRLKGLLTHFLEFARPQQPRIVASDCEMLLQSVAQLASETAKLAQVEIILEYAASLPPVSIDPEQIRQVLLNLVINAVQAMPTAGKVKLRADRDGEHVRIEVEDEGVGIPAEDLERVFDPFFTTRSSGTGLGLSIAYQIVNQHGGHISARKNQQRGMTFTVTLPVAARSSVTVSAER
jgi:signal transduction histidine kinase